MPRSIAAYVAALALGLAACSQQPATGPIVSMVDAIRAVDKRATIDLSPELAPLFPAGAPESEARNVLRENGFVVARDARSSVLVASHSQPRFIGYDEIRVILTLSADHVASTKASFFYHGL